jgi:hypothetical protein
MKTAVGRTRRIVIGVLLAATLASCSAGKSGSSAVVATPADSGLQPTADGFTFANFGSAASTEQFDSKDLVTMFGKAACVGGVEEPCALTTQAAAWARMVNEARASGHCEGLAVQAAARFDAKQNPVTGDLLNAGDVTHGIMRAFATQFLPEVQDATNSWAKKSLSDIVNELVSSMKKGSVEYSLGLYTPTGGHAVLPYAVQFPSKNLAVVKVYDSNWPGKERYVVFDLAAKKWFFSFNGQDPQKDECAWTGKAGDIDLTPMSVRTSATCPFCGAKTTVAKSVLLIRSTGVEWQVKTKNGTYSPSNSTAVDGTTVRGLRSASCSKTVSLPEFVLSVDTPDFELTLPETSSAYISNGKSVIQIQTTGKKARKPIKFTQTSVTSNDSGTTVTLAANNFATQVTADTSVINFGATSIVVDATVNGETKTVTANAEAPQVVVTTDTGVVVSTTSNVNLSKVDAVIPVDLTPTAVKPGLAPLAVREAAAPAVTTTIETATTTSSTAAGTTTLPSRATTTTVKPTTTTVKPTTTTGGTVATTPSTSGSNSSLSVTTTTVRLTSTTLTAAPTTTHAPTTTVTSPTTTRAPSTTVQVTTTTAAPNLVTVRFKVVGTGWTPIIRNFANDADYADTYASTDSVCNSVATCDGAERKIPYGDQFAFWATTSEGVSKIEFGNGAGFSNWFGMNKWFARKCDSSYYGYSGKVCEVTLYKTDPFYG